MSSISNSLYRRSFNTLSSFFVINLFTEVGHLKKKKEEKNEYNIKYCSVYNWNTDRKDPKSESKQNKKVDRKSYPER